MRIEYEQTLLSGSSLIEIVNPSTGAIDSIITILEYNVDLSTKELIVRGTDMTHFFNDNKYVGGTHESFTTNFIAYIQKTKPVTRKFSHHYPFTVYTATNG